MKLNSRKFFILLSIVACMLIALTVSVCAVETSGSVDWGSKPTTYTWSYDSASAVFTVSIENAAYGEKLATALKTDADFNTFVTEYGSTVTKLCVTDAGSTTLQEKFANLGFSNLETIIIGGSKRVGGQGNSTTTIFSGLSKLKYVEFTDDVENAAPDCVDLRNMITNGKNYVLNMMFYNCTSIEKVLLNETTPFHKDHNMLGEAMFAGCTSLTSINIPSWVTSLEGKVFKNCKKLQAIDLSQTSITAIGAEAFYGCASLTTVTLNSNPEIAAKSAFPDSASLTIYCPDEETESAIGELGYTNTNIVYEDPALKLLSGTAENCWYINSGNQQSKGADINWKFDTASETLYIWASSGSGVDFTRTSNPSGYNALFTSASFLEFAEAYASQVKTINMFDENGENPITVLSGNWSKGGFGALAGKGFANIEKIYVSDTFHFVACGNLFNGLSKLTTFGRVGTPDGTVDLSFCDQTNGTNVGTFSGQTGINTVKLANSASSTGTPKESGTGLENISDSHFVGMTGLAEVILSSKTRAIGANAFDGCEKLTRLAVPVGIPAATDYTEATLPLFDEDALSGSSISVISILDPSFADSTASKSLPDVEGLKIYTTSAALKAGFEEKYTLSKLVAIVGTVKAEGFAIRTTGYNGLRSLFSFDEALCAELKTAGVELMEYGGILVPSNKLNQLGDDFRLNVIRQNDTYFVNTGAATKIPIWSNGVLVGSKLSSSVENVKTDFAVTIVNFKQNFTNDVYACAYSVYRDPYGNEYVEFANYGTNNADLEHNSIAKIAVAMYTNCPSAEQADYEALLNKTVNTASVWNVLYQASTDAGVTALGDGAYAMTVTNSINGEEYRIVAAATRAEAQANAAEGDICIAVKDIEEKADTLAKKENTPLTEWNNSITTNIYNRAEHNARHPQGMASDGEYVYVSLAGKVLKIRISDGEEVGTYTTSIGMGFHMGDITCHGGYLYGSITGSGTYTDNTFIGVIKCSDIIGDKGDEILKIAHFYKLDSSDASYGFGGIDGIAAGNIPGKGYIDADGVVHNDDNKYLLVAVSGGVHTSDTTVPDTAYDNDNYKICAVAFSDVLNNAMPITSDFFCNATGLTSVEPVHTMYTYIGACRYGPQTMEVDKDTGDIILNMYSRPADSVYPEVSGAIVIDGSTMLRLEEIEVGQSVPTTSENYMDAQEQAAKYLVDGEYPKGYFVTLKCTCGLNGIEKHECVSYGDTGKEFYFCSGSLKAYPYGFVSLGDDFYYIIYWAGGSSDETGWACTAALRKLNHYDGAWSYSSYSYN